MVLLADDGVGRVGLHANEVGDGVGELGRATGIVDLGGVDALNPGVHVHDRAHARVLHVDLPMLDRIDGHAARLDAGRYRHHHRLRGLVVVGHEQHVAANVLQVRLVDTRGAHPETRRILTGRQVAVREATNRVEALDVLEVALIEVLLDRERRGQEVHRVETLAGDRQRLGNLVAIPQLGFEVGVPNVVDHEVALGEWREALGEVGEEGIRAVVGNRVVALLHRAETHLGAGDDTHGDVRQGSHEHGVVVADCLGKIGWWRIALVDCGTERRRALAAVRTHVLAVDEVADEVGSAKILGALVATCHEGGTEAVGEAGQRVRNVPVKGKSHRLRVAAGVPQVVTRDVCTGVCATFRSCSVPLGTADPPSDSRPVVVLVSRGGWRRECSKPAIRLQAQSSLI